MSAQDELLVAIRAQDHATTVLHSLAGEIGMLDTKMGHAGDTGKGMFGRIAEGAASFLTAGIVQNVAGQVAGMFTDGIGKAADFEQEMSKVKATSGASEAELASLRKT